MMLQKSMMIIDHVACSAERSDIPIIDVISSKVIKTLKTEYKVSLLTHLHGNLVFCDSNKGIKIINMGTGKIDKVRDNEPVDIFHV